MPPIETMHREEYAVWWTVKGVGDYGDTTYDPPQELQVRWEVGQREVLDPRGNRVAIDAMVITDRTIPPHSVLWRGSLAEYLGSGTGSGGEATEHWEVVFTSEIPDLKGREVRRVAMVRRFKDQSPPG